MTDTCDTTGKQRFPNPQAAGKVADSIHRRDRSNPTVYACNYCGGWHVGTPRRKRLILADKRKARDG